MFWLNDYLYPHTTFVFFCSLLCATIWKPERENTGTEKSDSRPMALIHKNDRAFQIGLDEQIHEKIKIQS